MPGRPHKIPSYCHHKASGQAVVRIDGKDEYLGPYGTVESYEKYNRLITERYPNGLNSVEPSLAFHTLPHRDKEITIVELIATYWQHVKGYYVKNGKPTSEQNSIRYALRPLKDLYGHELCRDFGPLALGTVQSKMIEQGITRKRINQHIGRIRRMFKWAVAKEILPVMTYEALNTLEGLRKGRSAAKESIPIKPVEAEYVEAVLPFLTPQIQSMVRLQGKTGCRPGEITIIRPCDVDQTIDPWIYTPGSHKTEHHNLERRIPIGTEAQRILLPWLNRPIEAYCFNPQEARAAYDSTRRLNRKTPQTPSSRHRKHKKHPKRKPGDHYTTVSYGRAIERACDRAKVPHWHPNQLRHNVATEVRRKYGLEGSQVVLGHSTANITQIYAERDFELAKHIMMEIG